MAQDVIALTCGTRFVVSEKTTDDSGKGKGQLNVSIIDKNEYSNNSESDCRALARENTKIAQVSILSLMLMAYLVISW